MSRSKTSSIKTPLKKARNLGSAKDGAHHWWVERLTAAAAVPLVIWFGASIISLIGAKQSGVHAFFQSGVNATLMAVLVITVFLHSAMGLQVVIEDYVHNHGKKLFLLIFVKFAHFALGAYAIAAIAKLHFGA